jgi:hypothetical protein
MGLSSFYKTKIVVIILFPDDPLQIKAGFTDMIVAPHTRFTIRYLTSGRNMIPSVWPVIYGMKQKPLVVFISTQIRFIKETIKHLQTG